MPRAGLGLPAEELGGWAGTPRLLVQTRADLTASAAKVLFHLLLYVLKADKTRV